MPKISRRLRTLKKINKIDIPFFSVFGIVLPLANAAELSIAKI
jgi:hypothetical protein